MKKNLFGIIIAVTVIGLVAGAAVFKFWFESPGIRLINGELHVEVSGIGYVFDGKTGEIIDESNVNIEGSSSTFEPDVFNGDASVPGYQNTESGTIETTLAVENAGSGFYLIRQLEKCTHTEEVNGISQNVEHLCDYFYTYYVYPEKEDFLIVLVESFDENEPVYVVCADNEDAARESYRWFKENSPE